jgi:hypothetical protein
MKRKIFALVVLMTCFTLGVSAQYYVGGSVGFTSSKMDNGGADQDGTSYKILPEIGYQLDDQMSIGLQIGYSHGYAAFGSLTVTDLKAAMNTMVSTYADVYEDNMKLNSFTFAPYIRYNMLKLGKADIFVEGSVGYTNVKADGDPRNANRESKIDVIEIAVRPGVSYRFNESLSAIAKLGSLGYMNAKEKESDLKITRFGLDCDTYNIMLGLNFHF